MNDLETKDLRADDLAGCQDTVPESPQSAPESAASLVGWKGQPPTADDLRTAEAIYAGEPVEDIAEARGVTSRAVRHWKAGNRRPVIRRIVEAIADFERAICGAKLAGMWSSVLNRLASMVDAADTPPEQRQWAMETVLREYHRVHGGHANNHKPAQANVQVNVGGSLDTRRELARRLREHDLSVTPEPTEVEGEDS